MNLEELYKPFDPTKIHWRTGATNAKKNGGKPTKGIALAYINARDVMDRLDLVVGAQNWQCRYPFTGCCEIGIRVNGEWTWKSDGAGETDIEGEKGQFSGAFKRAAVMWGVGRYLYALPNEWVELDDRGNIKTAPKLPEWATPNGWKRIPTDQKKAFYEQAIELMGNGDEYGLQELWSEWTDADEKLQLWSMFDSKQRSAMKAFGKGEAA